MIQMRRAEDNPEKRWHCMCEQCMTYRTKSIIVSRNLRDASQNSTPTPNTSAEDMVHHFPTSTLKAVLRAKLQDIRVTLDIYVFLMRQDGMIWPIFCSRATSLSVLHGWKYSSHWVFTSKPIKWSFLIINIMVKYGLRWRWDFALIMLGVRKRREGLTLIYVIKNPRLICSYYKHLGVTSDKFTPWSSFWLDMTQIKWWDTGPMSLSLYDWFMQDLLETRSRTTHNWQQHYSMKNDTSPLNLVLPLLLLTVLEPFDYLPVYQCL